MEINEIFNGTRFELDNYFSKYSLFETWIFVIVLHTTTQVRKCIKFGNFI